MDPDKALAELLAAARIIQAQRDGDELPLDKYIEHVDVVCDAGVALDDWLRRQGFLPKPWQREDRSAALQKACRGLLQDIGEVLERQGEAWWDETVTSGIHHRRVAEELVAGGGAA